MSLYSTIAEQLQYVSPAFYKKRFFKRLSGLTAQNVLSRKIEPEMLWLRDFLNADDIFFDVGANVGAYIFLLENKLKPGNIYAFEPNLKLNERLKRLFPKVNIFDVAFSDQNTVAEFKVPIINGKKIASRGTLQTANLEFGETGSVREKVIVKKLDDFIDFQHIKKINFIKIDVEGNELQTLRGAKNTLEKFRPAMMVEIEQRHHQQPIWSIISDVESWGYRAHYLDRNNFKMNVLTEKFITAQNAENLKQYEDYINNIIFLPV